MTDQFYGEESIKIKQTAKTGWVQSEFRKQEKYRRNYYGTIFPVRKNAAERGCPLH